LEVSERRRRRGGGGGGGGADPFGATSSGSSSNLNTMGRKKIQISRITDERNRQVRVTFS